MPLGASDRNRCAERIAAADEHADFELIVEALTRPEHRPLGARRQGLADRPVERMAGHDDRGGATVIGNRHPPVVGCQRVLRAEQAADR